MRQLKIKREPTEEEKQEYLDKKKKETEAIIKQKNDLKMDRSIRDADAQLKQLEFDVSVEFGNVKIAIADGDQNNKPHANAGVSGQRIKATKRGQTIQMNICGITVDIYSDFSHLKKFGEQFANQA